VAEGKTNGEAVFGEGGDVREDHRRRHLSLGKKRKDRERKKKPKRVSREKGGKETDRTQGACRII